MRDDLLLSLFWAVPLGGSAVVLMIPERHSRVVPGFALGTCLVTLALALGTLGSFLSGPALGQPLAQRAASNPLISTVVASNSAIPDHDLVVRNAWIPQFGMEYYLGLDGINLVLILLTALVGSLACLASWGITHRVRGYFALFLLLQSSLMGVFLALDLILFYVFFEVLLLPMYFLIALWGGERREYAALKFLLYTLFGSVFILVAILALFFWPGDAPVGPSGFAGHTFDMVRLAAGAATTGWYGPGVQGWVFGLLLLGFAVKLPSFPFHTWLPDAHVEAPTPISMVLAGVLLKIGGYGLIRLAWPLAPLGAAAWAVPVAALGVFGILYGALVALGQTDFKKLVAYSSVSHMGYVTVGLGALTLGGDPRGYALGLDGAVYMMVAHGLTATGLFFLVGLVYDRTGTRDLRALGGLGHRLPGLLGVAIVLIFGAMGLPGLCGFWAEVLVILAAFQFRPIVSILAAFAVVLTAAYMLRAFRRVFLGPMPEGADATGYGQALSAREWLIAAPLVVLTVVLGVAPRLVLDWVSPSVEQVATTIVGAGAPPAPTPLATPGPVLQR